MPTTHTLTLTAEQLDDAHLRVLTILVDEIETALEYIDPLLAIDASASDHGARDAHGFLCQVRGTIDTLDALGWPRGAERVEHGSTG